jgi:iron only hydrogenase large subunit-like protein
VQAGSIALQPPVSGTAGGKGFAQTRLDADTSAVKVTLQDCLACSGCVTSAETVLLEHQSIGELRAKIKVLNATPLQQKLFVKPLIVECCPLSLAVCRTVCNFGRRACHSHLQEEGTTVIVSVSPQSRASLGEAAGLDPETVQRRLTSFFTKLVSNCPHLPWLSILPSATAMRGKREH